MWKRLMHQPGRSYLPKSGFYKVHAERETWQEEVGGGRTTYEGKTTKLPGGKGLCFN
jgi:hypothetical protein